MKRKRSIDIDRVLSLDKNKNTDIDSTPYPSNTSLLRLFSMLPEEIVEKIILKSISLESQVVLQGICKSFHALCPKSYVEYKWDKHKNDLAINAVTLNKLSQFAIYKGRSDIINSQYDKYLVALWKKYYGPLSTVNTFFSRVVSHIALDYLGEHRYI